MDDFTDFNIDHNVIQKSISKEDIFSKIQLKIEKQLSGKSISQKTKTLKINNNSSELNNTDKGIFFKNRSSPIRNNQNIIQSPEITHTFADLLYMSSMDLDSVGSMNSMKSIEFDSKK